MPECVLVIATIHGNEAAGTPLVQELRKRLYETPALLGHQHVVILDVANPDGLARDSRTNAHGIDLNRNFPAGNFKGSGRHGEEPLSEPESRALHDLILREKPARIVSIHQPLACIDWDGPAEDLARAMAAACDLPAKRVGSRPGSLGSWAGLTLGIPIITLELRREDSALSGPELWSRYGAALRVFIRGGASAITPASTAARRPPADVAPLTAGG